MTIAIGNDHAGTDYKFAIVAFLKALGHDVLNFGTDKSDSVELGILICGSANGVAMTANKYKEVRAGLCWTKEIVSLAKQHNDANILSLPARYLSLPQALEMVEVYLDTPFEGGRHANRVAKIGCS